MMILRFNYLLPIYACLINSVSENLHRLQLRSEHLRINANLALQNISFHRNTIEGKMIHYLNNEIADIITLPILEELSRIENDAKDMRNYSISQKSYCYDNVRRNITNFAIAIQKDLNPCITEYTEESKALLNNTSQIISNGSKLLEYLEELPVCDATDMEILENCMNKEIPRASIKVTRFEEMVEKNIKHLLNEEIPRISAEVRQCMSRASNKLQSNIQDMKSTFDFCLQTTKLT